MCTPKYTSLQMTPKYTSLGGSTRENINFIWSAFNLVYTNTVYPL